MRRLATDTDPIEAPAASPDPEQASAARAAAEQIRGFASELEALLTAVGGLASAEASLSLNAFLRMLGLRAIVIVLASLAIVLLAVAGTTLLAQALGSASAALASVAVGALVCAAFALWRARVWRDRIGFEATRAALLADSRPPEEPRP